MPVIYVSQYDTGQTWNISLYEGSAPFNVPASSSVLIQGTKADSTGFQYSCTYADNVVTAAETQQMTAFAGDVQAEIVIAKNGDQIATINFIIRVEAAALRDDTVISETELPLVEEAAEAVQRIPALIAEVEDLAEDAESYAVGTRGGVPVPSTDPAYQNNAKYYAENFLGYVTDSQYSAIQTILS